MRDATIRGGSDDDREWRVWRGNDGGTDLGMIITGIILALIGVLVGIPILTTIGVILVIAGAVLAILGSAGRAVGGRPHWY